MKRRLRLSALPAVAVCAVLALAGCSSNDASSTVLPSTSSSAIVRAPLSPCPSRTSTTDDHGGGSNTDGSGTSATGASASSSPSASDDCLTESGVNLPSASASASDDHGGTTGSGNSGSGNSGSGS
jgi:hypothetical protein